MDLRSIVTVGKETDVHQLARQFSQEVFAADDLIEALDITHRNSPDLIIFDHRFTPDCIKKFLSVASKNCEIHIVIIGSDENDSHFPEKFIEAGANHYLR
ncbi:MAG: hypothetical protein B6I36_10100, partial [Desulfobacteraceae bacterium 4572_35.1]